MEMNSDDQFWVFCWKCLTIILCVTIVSITSCTAFQAHTIHEMVRAGTSPIEAACAFKDGNSPVCLTQLGK
jgi:hypothetical protein